MDCKCVLHLIIATHVNYPIGAAVIFAQFKSINQFTAIGWFNVAYGLAALILLVVMFRGEMKWKKVRVDQCLRCPKTKGSSGKSCGGIGLLPLFISFSLHSS